MIFLVFLEYYKTIPCLLLCVDCLTLTLFRRLSVRLGYGIIVVRGAGDLVDQANEKKTKWHSPIYRGLQLDLRGSALKFVDNVSLSEEALEIDAVITKDNDIQVENDIGAIFKGHNVCEFKSVTYAFKIKAMGYTILQAMSIQCRYWKQKSYQRIICF